MAGEDGTPPPPPTKIESNSPFFLGPQDRPGDFITPVRLRTDNFDAWAHAIRVSLSSRRKFGFLDGSIRSFAPPVTRDDWVTIQCMLVSWIMNTIDPEVQSLLSNYDNAKLLWDDLNERFSVVNGPRIQQLKADINRCEQTKLMPVATYFGKLKVLWDELANHEPILCCTCGKCTCNLGQAHEKRREADRLQQFLLGLYSEYYAPIRSTLLSQDPLPSLNRAFQQVVQEERVRGIAQLKDEKPEAVGFTVRTDVRGRGRIDKSSLACTHCHKTGHDVTTCFEVHGHPEWWLEKFGKSGDKGVAGRGKPGGRGRGGARANATKADSAHGNPGAQMGSGQLAAPPTGGAALPAFTPEQWQSILAAFGTPQPPSNRLNGKTQSTSWIIDTGCSNHVTGDPSCLIDIKEVIACPVGLPNGETVVATQAGIAHLTDKICLKHVLLVPQLNCNLISVSQLDDDLNCFVQFSSNMCAIQDLHSRELIGAGERRDGLYYLRQMSTVKKVSVDASSSLELWHKRMGHPSEKVVKLLPTISNFRESLNKACEVCHRAKQHRNSFQLSESNATRLFELVHCDLWGPYNATPSSCGARYFLTLVDDFSRAVWVYLLIDKKEVFQMFMAFIAMIDRQFNQKIKFVRSDNGTEFHCLQDYFEANGILFQSSCVGTPQQNGRVERKHQHILNVARALRFQAHLPLYFWGECVLAAAHLINRTPSLVLHNKTPYEQLFGSPPLYNEIRVFGSLCFAHNQRAQGDKFASRSRKCVFVGYPFGKKGWYLFDLDTKQFFVSRDVKFYEDIFPFVGTDIAPHKSNNWVPMHGGEDVDFVAYPDEVGETHDAGPSSSPTQHDAATSPLPATPIVPAAPLVSTPFAPPALASETTSPTVLPASGTELGRGHREKFPSVKLRDFVTHTVIQKSPSLAPPAPQTSSGTPFPIAHYVNCDKFSVKHRNFLAAVTVGVEPQSFKEAMKDAGWRGAMQKEIRALEDNGTWTMETLPPGKKALGSQWVYKIKYNSDGSVERLKARLVVFGNHQIEGIDYNETFAPVAKMVTVRAFLAIAASKNWELHQMDVHNAFLHGDLDEEVYMKLPPGFDSDTPGLVCRLRKSLYGLKQAPRCWFAKLVTALKGYGFLQSFSDYSLFTYTKGSVQINVLVYVDDIIISGNDSAALKAFKAYLSACFHMKDLGVLKYFLGIEVARNPSGLFLCQRKYTLDIISEAGLLGAKPASFSMEQHHKLAHATGALLVDPLPYRRLLGRLIYLAVTRPDLAYSVHVLSQFMHEPRQEHWEAALRVVRYLKSSPGQGILLRSDSDLSLSGWCDSDWAACPLTRRSLTGWLVFLGQSPIAWKTKKQHTVSRSSAEAEYRSMASLTCELKWLKALLLSLGVHHPSAIPLFCDSQSALHIAKNPVFHERTKHIEVDCHFVRDAIQDGLIAPSYVPTTIQIADLFTKALGKRQFDFLLGKLGICDPHAPT